MHAISKKSKNLGCTLIIGFLFRSKWVILNGIL